MELAVIIYNAVIHAVEPIKFVKALPVVRLVAVAQPTLALVKHARTVAIAIVPEQKHQVAQEKSAVMMAVVQAVEVARLSITLILPVMVQSVFVLQIVLPHIIAEITGVWAAVAPAKPLAPTLNA